MRTRTLEHLSPAEYLIRERESEFRSEYLDGEIRPMAGASQFHVLISADLMFLLRSALKNRDRRIYQSDLRVRAGDAFFYPDIVVTSGREEYLDAAFDALLNPVLVIEVLSPATKEYDRGRKFESHRLLSSLRQYVLVDQERPSVEVFHRNDAGEWSVVTVKGMEKHIDLVSVGRTLQMEEIYENVEFNNSKH